MMDVEVADEVGTADAEAAVIVQQGDGTNPYRYLTVTPEARYLWVTIPLSPNMLQPISKQPSAVLDYGIIWTSWLQEGETIASSHWDVPPGLEIVDEYVTPEGVAVVWLTGGLDGERYTLTNSITTNSTPIQRHEVRQLQVWVSPAA